MNKTSEVNKSNNEKFQGFLIKEPKWLKISSSSKESEEFQYNVVYNATRFIRNFEGFIFPEKIEKQTLYSIETRVDKELKKNKLFHDFIKIKIDSLTDSEIKVLSEKRVIPNFKIQERKNVRLYIHKNEKIFILLNYRDHLSVFSFEKGSNVKKSFNSASKILKIFNKDSFSKDDNGNFLTSDINYFGTGCKIFLLTILPYLKFRNNLKRVTSNLKKNGMAHFKHFNFSKKREDLLSITNNDSFLLKKEELLEKLVFLSRELEELEYTAKDKALNTVQSDPISVAEFLKNKLTLMIQEKEIDLKKFVLILSYMIMLDDIITKNIKDDLGKEKLYKKIISKLVSGLALYQVGHLSLIGKNSLSIKEGDLKRAKEIKKVFVSF